MQTGPSPPLGQGSGAPVVPKPLTSYWTHAPRLSRCLCAARAQGLTWLPVDADLGGWAVRGPAHG